MPKNVYTYSKQTRRYVCSEFSIKIILFSLTNFLRTLVIFKNRSLGIWD
jgi:hypothetical protein